MDSANSLHSNPVEVITSDDWRSDYARALKSQNVRNPLVVTTKGTVDRAGLVRIFPEVNIFQDVEPNPTFASCQAAIDFALRGEFDGVVAIGGGSPMDTAKAVMAALGTGQEAIAELLAYSEPYPHKVPSIFIPTTHGTGSEVTMWCTLWDLETMTKHSLSHPDLYPDVAVLDPGITLALPMDISLATTLDALSHSFEALWNKNANDTSTEHAIKAIVAILEQVPLLKTQPGNRDVRKHLLHAANTAGLAFSNTKTAAAHSISYPLTLNFGVPHGIAASIPLLPLLDINGSAIEPVLRRIYDRTKLGGMDELKNKISEIPEGKLPYRLREWGIGKDQLEWLATRSFTRGRMDNNIVDLTRDDVQGILEAIY